MIRILTKVVLQLWKTEMKFFTRITNGVFLIIIGVLHSQLFFSSDGFGYQFKQFCSSCFFEVSKGMDELPALPGNPSADANTALWFLYFGLLLFPLGLLVHSIERKNQTLPHLFTVSYLIFVAIGSYMVPNSGMTFIMLPHAVYMLVVNIIRKRYLQKVSNN